MAAFSKMLRNVWAGLTGRTDPAARASIPPVIVHDPAAQRAHDLDDPFFDEKVQTRIADVISHAGQHK